MKAFPGLGTLAGGALHAVTYGMIFDALGRSLNETLASRGELATLPVINRFTENLGDQLEKSTGNIIRLVMESQRQAGKNNTARSKKQPIQANTSDPPTIISRSHETVCHGYWKTNIFHSLFAKRLNEEYQVDTGFTGQDRK